MSDKITALRAEYFDNHKDVKELWFTSDGFAKFSENAASTHARALVKDKRDGTVDHITRDEVNAWRKEQEAATEAIDSGGSDKVIDVDVTKEVLKDNPDLAEAGVKAGDVIQVLLGKTAQQLQDEAQAVYDAAVKSGNTDDIINTKKALSAAKARVTREGKKG